MAVVCIVEREVEAAKAIGIRPGKPSFYRPELDMLRFFGFLDVFGGWIGWNWPAWGHDTR